MSESYVLDFEKPIVEMEHEVRRLRALVEAGDLSHASDAEKLTKRLEKLKSDVFGSLKAYQRVKLSRHIDRPFTLDFVEHLIDNFSELHGDRCFGDDGAIVGGLGTFDNRTVMVVGHQRGRTTQERMKRNFGMPQPEGNRKAQRLFKLAEKFGFPLLLFVDTQGAYPGLEAEQRGQAESIASSLAALSNLRVPIISTVIGEGGSGGALALGICDRLLMLENATYSVITPEGCASILWGKTESGSIADYAAEAAEALKLTARGLIELGIADEIVPEPLGGAHRDREKTALNLRLVLTRQLNELVEQDLETLLQNRHEKFRSIGKLL